MRENTRDWGSGSRYRTSTLRIQLHNLLYTSRGKRAVIVELLLLLLLLMCQHFFFLFVVQRAFISAKRFIVWWWLPPVTVQLAHHGKPDQIPAFEFFVSSVIPLNNVAWFIAEILALQKQMYLTEARPICFITLPAFAH